MKELTYNIIRKMIENPTEVEYKRDSLMGFSGNLYIKESHVLGISHMKYADVLMNHKHSLPDKDLRRILSVVEHCEAMKIRGL